MKRLVFRTAPPRGAPRPGETVIVLEAAEERLDAGARDAVDEAAIAWTKQWGRVPLQDGLSFRELLEWKGVSLWWFAELFLHHSTESPRYVRLIDTLHRLLDAEGPDEVEADGLPGAEAALLGRVCTARGILFHGPRRAPGWPRRWRVLRTSLASRLNTLKARATFLKAALGGPAPVPARDGRDTVLFLSHAAFWRERPAGDMEPAAAYEHYFDRLIPEVARDPALRPFVVAVGPRAAFRRRGPRERLLDWVRLPAADGGPYVHVNRYTNAAVVREAARGARQVRRAWRALRGSPALLAAFSHRGVSFADLAAPDLAGTMLLQLPWAIRCYEEMAQVLAAVRPRVVCLYAESSGWGRAALAACRAMGVPSVAVQHGIVYPKYYSYRHDVDEDACPRPDRTAVFGEAAGRLLRGMGRYPAHTLVTTGSPKFDDLLRGARERDRDSLRRRLGVREGERLVVVASRFRAIRRTHQAIGTAFPALVRAIESLPDARALVKPHPAEPEGAYDGVLRREGARRVAVLPPGADLVEVLHAADALVTVESLSAVEALVLGRPVVVLNMPTHLRELVDQGVALGVAAGEDPAPALRAALFDQAVRGRLAEARARYLSDFAMGVDGRATARIAALLRASAGRAEETPGADGMVG
ncbi:MAG TPA: CDP-glycerol glycerophosphotransferase family protein [Vicinamibacteria bacterium]|nr:CDP-glycerol glycerophosphotransferase family protein [Vicinamibacteria bacterium]